MGDSADAAVLSSAARGDLLHFSPGRAARDAAAAADAGPAASPVGFDLGSALTGLSGVLSKVK